MDLASSDCRTRRKGAVSMSGAWKSELANGPTLRSTKVCRAPCEAGGISRQLVIMASDADAEALVASQEFLAVSVLPGLLDDAVTPDSQYGAARERVRERTAWRLASRLPAYPGRVLVVIGASEEAHLARLYAAEHRF